MLTIRNGGLIEADLKHGETPDMVLTALAFASYCLAPPVDADLFPANDGLPAGLIREHVRGAELLLIAVGGRACLTQVTRLPLALDRYQLNLGLFEGEPAKLIAAANDLLDLFLERLS